MKADARRKIEKMLDEIRVLHANNQPFDESKIPNPIDWASSIGITLDEWQKHVIQSDSKRQLLLCPRQVGKSFVSALYGAYMCIYRPGKNVIVIAPTLRQSRLLFARIDKFIIATRDKSRIITRNTTLIELAHGGKVTALPGDKPDMVRGMTADLILVDEGAFIRDEVLGVLLPMLATTNGRLVVLSTPSGPEGFFFRAWNGEENWERTKIDIRDCPRITSEFLDDARKRLGRITYEQEYECIFHQSAGAFFDAEAVNRIFGVASIGASFETKPTLKKGYL